MSPVVEDQSTPVGILEAEHAQRSVIDSVRNVLRKNPRMEWLILLALCAVMLGQLLLSVRQLSQTTDEATHLYSGYRYLKCGDLTFSPEHPPLAKIIAAAPLVSMNPHVDCSPFHGNDVDQWKTSFVWLYSNNWRSELFRARLAISIFSIILCVLVWVVARCMFGIGAAIVATLLLIFEPNILAYGGLVLTDIPVTAMLLFGMFGFYLWTRRPCVPLLALAGMAVGLTLLAKNSGLVIIPVLIFLAVADAFLPQFNKRYSSKLVIRNLATAGLILLIAYAVIWVGYGMRYSAHSGPPLPQETPSSLPSTSIAGRMLIVLEAKHLLPQSYLEGFANDPHSILRVLSSTPTSEPRAQWFALPRNLSIRCTVGFLAMSVLSVTGVIMSFAKHRREIVFLLVPVVLFAAGFMHASWNGGIRHLLPMFPFLIVLASVGCLELMKHSQWVKYAVACLIVLHAGSSLHAFPNYLSYGNEFWGGPTQSYKYLGGTDLQQSYWQAKAYMEQHPSDNCWLITGDLPLSKFYGLPCQHIGFWHRELAPSQMNGTVLVSSSEFYSARLGEHEIVEPFKNIPPTDSIGGSSILVFKGNFDTRATASMIATDMAGRALLNSRLSQAQELSDYAIRMSPQSVYGHFIHAAVLTQLGEPTAAMSELEYARNLALNKPMDATLLTEIDNGMQTVRGIAVAH
jgi:4-amino-4-deoxy-L-arabinose transferase-like glycosyltransferase